MYASFVTPTVSALDHERLLRIASAGLRIRRVPPSAKLLASELERARVVSPASLPPNVISMHSIFDFRDGITVQIRRGVLVYPGEEDEGLGRISVLSPLGAALIGLAEGQSFQWRSATGVRRTLQVIRVVHQPERASADEEHHARAAPAPMQSELMRSTR
ncbi:nucleoside diphosphate kinase regulator [Microvirga lotononidis]|uniref:Transcription elongation factor n=1 Tax=Microvirga lotononidis TaxID=864069 RepID=I4Z0U7_9HYPH|nr:nucleoside diphosphate kinase regulator [Microvirga lotononidis]EIM29839.1 transcription elongation factor [Microvirga lotononidis]WQO31075.1 nucleoside diphosphate kinase regulator [Microvirga lotononidis]